MRAAVNGVDIVRERAESLAVEVGVILESGFNGYIVHNSVEINYVGVELLRAAHILEPFDIAYYTALVFERFAAYVILVARIGQLDKQTAVKKRLLAHTVKQSVIIIMRFVEYSPVRLKAHACTGLIGLSDNFHLLVIVSAAELLIVNFVSVIDFKLEPFRKSIYNRRAYAVQAARNLISAAAELTARVENGINYGRRGNALFRVNSRRYSSAVIGYFDNVSGEDFHLDFGAVPRESFVYRVIDDFINEMMQTGRASRTDIHTGALADRLKPLKNLYIARVVFVIDYLGVFVHLLTMPFCIKPLRKNKALSAKK